MVLCIIAFIVFGIMSIFSAKYRPLAKEGFRCVFRTLTMKPCDTGLDQKFKTEVVYSVMRYSPGAARFVNKQFALISWIFVLLTLASFGYSVYGVYNFYVFGNCEGPNATSTCILNDLTGDYGRFSSPTELISPTSLDGIKAGNSSSNLTIVEFGCFVCPYTKKAEPLVKELLNTTNVNYIFKPFPLPNHNNSFIAAQAVLCAVKQDKAWEMRERVFAHQETCSVDGTLAINDIAESSGMNMTLFKGCMNKNETVEELNKYIEQGKAAHIYATPTFFINGKPLVGPKSIGEFKGLIK